MLESLPFDLVERLVFLLPLHDLLSLSATCAHLRRDVPLAASREVKKYLKPWCPVTAIYSSLELLAARRRLDTFLDQQRAKKGFRHVLVMDVAAMLHLLEVRSLALEIG